jgi:hypothetical protein
MLEEKSGDATLYLLHMQVLLTTWFQIPICAIFEDFHCAGQSTNFKRHHRLLLIDSIAGL